MSIKISIPFFFLLPLPDINVLFCRLGSEGRGKDDDGLARTVKTIGAYWALLAEAVPKDRIDRFISHLENPQEFNTPHRVPALR